MGLGRVPRWDLAEGPALRASGDESCTKGSPGWTRAPLHTLPCAGCHGTCWQEGLGQELVVLIQNKPSTAQLRTQPFHPDHTPAWPQSHVLFSPCDFLAMGRRKMESSGSLPSAGTAWTTGDRGCCQRDSVAHGPRDLLAQAGGGHTGELGAPV